ncbi:CusA/CzcA family heavy metal efflux RND transporter [Flavobacterium sp. 102]|nr:CusA/CzcA family heavy metal efflux RND transporter [Flavobacterium sp. 102]RKS02182.1 cobalt-zinc-cadmium resistance protein CzcA [Flavobacterium sp. 102]
MLNKIIAFSVRNKLVIGLFTIALLLYGIYETTKLPIDAVPDITNNQVQVITIAPSFGATDIERLVTFPVEQANSNISGLKEIRSFSRFGLSLVTIVFDDETDIYWARQQVAERLQQVQTQIPAGIGTPELGPVSTGLGEIYQYMVRPEKGYEEQYDETELRTIQDWIVRRQLLGVKGVAEVSSFGGKLKQFEVAIESNKLHAYGLTVDDIFAALEKNNQNTGGAYIEKGATTLFIRSEGLIGNVEDIENIAVKATPSGIPLFLRDIAKINIGYATRYGAMCYNDEGEVAGAIVMMLKGANSSEVIKNVKERIEQIKKTLPEGVTIEPFLDRTKMVNNAIGTVEKNLMEGALIVIFVLVLFLGNLRAGLIVASVIPLAMLFAIILMNTFGVSGNLMSLGALDFGLIVDGAVIIVEAVMHQLSHSKKFSNVARLTQNKMDKEVENSAGKMMNSAVFGQIIILIVYLPIFTLEGIEGKMFKPMAQTVAFALLGAFLLSLTYIPMMSALFLSKKINHQPNFSDRMMFKLERKYQHWLQVALNFQKVIIGTVIALFVIALFLLSSLGGEFIPALEEGDFAVDTRVLTGSNLNTTIESTQKAAHILKTRFPEVEKVVTKIGSGEVPTDPMPMEASDMMVILKDKSEWTSAETFDELAEKMGKALEDVPGITAGFQYPVQMRFNELMTGARQDVVCKIFGENLDTLALYAEKLGKIVNTVDGAEDLFVEPVTGMPQVIIDYNRTVIAQYHLNIADINRIVNTAFAGQSTGLVFEGEKRFELVVRLDSEKRKNLEDVRNLLIPTPQGTQIPLSQLANVSIKNGPNQIQREDAKRRIVVGFNVNGRDVESIVNELKGKVENEIQLPAGYYTTYGGAFENLNQAKDRLMIAVPISLLLIFILLFFAFKSVKHGLLIYSAIPLSAIGGIFFLALRGMPFSISAGIGFIALFGVAVLNGIVLISEFNRLKSEGMDDLNRIVLMGTKVRLRPVLMTAFVASLGFLPMAISSGSGAEVQRPLATVVIGGLMIATLLTLFVLPILYVTFEKGFKMKIFNKTTLLLLLLSFCILPAKAQTKITLEEALKTALENNQSVKIERLKSDYQQKLIRSATNLPTTNVNSEFGQINSSYNDTRFGISQSFDFPMVYNRQKKVLTSEWKTASALVLLKEAALKKEITQTFYAILSLTEKEKLLQKSDTLLTEFLRKSALRLQKGESNILEKTTAETQLGQLKMQLLQLQQDKELLQSIFQLLLNSENKVTPKASSFKIERLNGLSESTIDQHPMLQTLEQQKETAVAQTQLEKARKFPILTLGYNNMSITGNGADNVLYDNSTRFHSAQIGLGIPLLGGSQNAKVRAAKVQEQIVEEEYLREKNSLKLQLQNTLLQLEKNIEKLDYFEKIGLPNALLITETANRQFLGGDINYLDWVLLVNQALMVNNSYIESVNAYNESIIELNYLTSKN